MIAEGSSSQTPGGEPPHQSERDLLAERRALRAAQMSDPALVRRAEAAEATVQTLETHLTSLRQRLHEAEEERRGNAQRLADSENELRRVSQQEYAEQQLRAEAERALAVALDRSPDGALARSEVVQGLRARVAEVERRAGWLAQEIESERRARERTERELEAMRESHATMAVTVSELRDVARRLRDAAALSASRSPAVPALPVLPTPARAGQEQSQVRREEMADALAAAVERLRARAEESLAQPQQAPVEASPPPPAPVESPVALAIASAPSAGAKPAIEPKPHKHSMSLIGRLRYARKHRHDASRDAGGSPSIGKHR